MGIGGDSSSPGRSRTARTSGRAGAHRPAVAPPAAKRPEPAPTAKPRSSSRPGRTRRWTENAAPASIHQEASDGEFGGSHRQVWPVVDLAMDQILAWGRGPPESGVEMARRGGNVGRALLAGWLRARHGITAQLSHQGRHAASPAAAPALVRTHYACCGPNRLGPPSRAEWRSGLATRNGG